MGSKWYHIVVRIDTTQSTDSDRAKIYIDGVEQALQTTNYPSLNAEFGTSQTSRPMVIGRYNYNNTRYMDGQLAEVNFTDGQSYGPETFGVTDTSTGRWFPKSLSGITYGTNGFRLTFAAAAALGTDTSGQSNNFTPNNLSTTDQTVDNPNDNFINFGGAYRSHGTQQAAEDGGFTIYASNGSGYTAAAATKEIPQSGKWYWEVKLAAVGSVQGITNPT